jgi:hypothetical protein
MDFVRPVEALIPGAQGRILAACLRADEPLTMRALGRLAGVSPNQTTLVLDQLESLGLVRRQSAGRALLVSLETASPVVDALRLVADLRNQTLRLWRDRAHRLAPAPVSLAVYGSWARGEAGPGSDVDVIVILPASLAENDEDEYREQIADWCEYARRVAGLPVSPIVVAAGETEEIDSDLWSDIRRDAVVIAGIHPGTVRSAA